MKPASQGFSLIEVLIAAFIMFISLAAFTSIFQGALLASSSATKSIDSTAVTAIITDSISFKIKANHANREMKGEEQLLGKTFLWDAKVISETRPQARYFGKELIQPEHTAKIWLVKLKDKDSGAEYHYEEVSW